MNATYTVESESDFSKMFNDVKDVNAWFALERLVKSLQREMCEEIDREIIENLKREAQITCASSVPSVSSSTLC